MEAERKNNRIQIKLTGEETFRIQRGEIIGERLGVTMPDAKIEVAPLSHAKIDDSAKDTWASDRLAKAKQAPLEIIVYLNGDLTVYVPAIKLTDVRIASAELPRSAIKTLGTEDTKGLVEHVIPEGGVKLIFGGSLKRIHIPDFFA